MNIYSKFSFSLLLSFLSISFFVFGVPSVISHRGGGQNFPENTLYSFSKSIEIGCDALELDVQVTKDGVVVVYHPDDLKQWTNGLGKVSEHTWDVIKELDAGYNFKQEGSYPFRGQNLKIPKFEEVLEQFPKTKIIVDMKSLPVEPLVNALVDTISDEEAERLIFYSTNSDHIDLLNHLKPHWKTFEKRDATRQRLLDLNQKGVSDLPLTSNWVGFELKRKMVVTETFALGQGSSSVDFYLWSINVVSFLKHQNPYVSLVLFGINTKEEWEKAIDLGVDGVYTDNPKCVAMWKHIGKSQ